MRKGISKCLCVVAAAVLLLGGIQIPMPVNAQENVQKEEVSPQSGEQGVTVSTNEEFMAALQQCKSPIIVNNQITIVNGAEASGRMLPIKIPANTVIRGASPEIEICTRSPIQIEGDGVCFQNMKLTFESSTALGSVPHREIFLAGHSLIMDNVDTYLAGGANIGGFGGTEKELLPTVYAGGFTGAAVGANAALTVRNSNENTMFQAIYMGHDAGNENNVPYSGSAVLNLDVKTTVRDRIDTSLNSRAEINITGTNASQYARAKEFYGNEETTLSLSNVSMEDAVLDRIGNLILKDGACMAPKTDYLQNVAVQSGACLDFNGVMNPLIEGNFTGVSSSGEERGILVLNPEGKLMILGDVSGTTQFQTSSRLFPTVPLKKTYIEAKAGSSAEPNFVLAQKFIDAGYTLDYIENTGWTVGGEAEVFREVGRIEVNSAPARVDLRKIPASESLEIPDEEIYFDVTWYDTEGIPFSHDDVIDDYYLLYEAEYVVRIRTDYWNSNDDAVLTKEDWSQAVTLTTDENHQGRYYLQAFDGAVPGDYTFLFFGDPSYSQDLVTVADVKALKNMVMAECRVIFYNQDGEGPDHTHAYEGTVTKEPTCTEAGIRTYTCSECGDKYTEEIAASGHQEVIDPAVEPTETTSGKTEGSHCGVCGTIIKAQEEIPALGKPEEPGHTHIYEAAVTKEPTCTEKGIRTYTCSCGDTYTEEIAVLNHKHVRKCVPATIRNSGKVQQVCSVCSRITGIVKIASPKKIVLGKTDYSYDGRLKTPSVTVTDANGIRLRAGTAYQAVYPKTRKNPGVYTVTVKFRGNYSGTVTRTFTIRPKKTSLGTITGRSRGMQVSWKKQTVQMDGYQIQYSTNGSFKGTTTKSVTAKRNTTVKRISKLKGNTKYYVRIRTYKTVKAGGKNKKLYSDWSVKKTVRTKR